MALTIRRLVPRDRVRELRAELARMVARRRENREAPAVSLLATEEASPAAS